MKLITLVLLSLTTLLFACSSEPVAKVHPIKMQDLQQQWSLISIDNKAVETSSSLKVDDNASATGNLACNNFFGTVEIQANKLRIDKMGSTRKMCEPAANDIEMIVSSTLSDWSKVTISDKQLTISGAQHTLIYAIK